MTGQHAAAGQDGPMRSRSTATLRPAGVERGVASPVRRPVPLLG
ncbi:hypothetical protein [Haloarcula litorea]|nr:hypothetical protein [Halomicroarcula sp. GDY20]